MPKLHNSKCYIADPCKYSGTLIQLFVWYTLLLLPWLLESYPLQCDVINLPVTFSINLKHTTTMPINTDAWNETASHFNRTLLILISDIFLNFTQYNIKWLVYMYLHIHHLWLEAVKQKRWKFIINTCEYVTIVMTNLMDILIIVTMVTVSSTNGANIGQIHGLSRCPIANIIAGKTPCNRENKASQMGATNSAAPVKTTEASGKRCIKSRHWQVDGSFGHTRSW